MSDCMVIEPDHPFHFQWQTAVDFTLDSEA